MTAKPPVTIEQFDELLRSNGHRSTRPRRVAWQVLLEADGHLTAEQIDAAVRAAGEHVDLASVYRSLALFAELGIARETHLGEDASHWEAAHPDEHFHLKCLSCGAVDHHVGSLVEQIRDHLSGGHGFEVHRVELIVTGHCANCRDAAH